MPRFRRARALGVIATLLVLLLRTAPASAQETVTLAWDPSQSSDVAGYLVAWGTQPDQYPQSLDVGATTHVTIGGLKPHLRYYFTVRAYNAGKVLSPPAPYVTNGGIDFTSGAHLLDDRPGMFWQHVDSGDLRTWHLNGRSLLQSRTISMGGVADKKWRVAATGDIDGDGHPDILWQHADGWLAWWGLRHNQVMRTEYLTIPQVADRRWRVAGIGDVDGDGYGDIVWQHVEGWLAVWLMRGSNVVSTRYLSIPRMTDSDWTIKGVSDLDGDGRADLLWQHADGWLAAWTLHGSIVTGTQYLSINRMTDPAWKIAAFGRVDAAETPAIIWRHDDGTVALWWMRGFRVIQTVLTAPDKVSTDWSIVGSR